MRPRVRRSGPLHWVWTCPCQGGTPAEYQTWKAAFGGAFIHATWGMVHIERREADSLARFVCGDTFND